MPAPIDCIVRRAKERDGPRIALLWEEMMRYHERFDPRFAIAPDGRRRYEEYLRDMLHNVDHRVLAAEVDRQVVGYTIGMILANPPVFQLPQYGFLAEMSVAEALRGQGIGKLLWDELLAWFRSRGITVVQLNVSTINERGQRFWRSRGCRDFLHILWHDLGEE